MRIIDAFSDWTNLAVGLGMASSFILGVVLGSRARKKQKHDWPTPYPRENE